MYVARLSSEGFLYRATLFKKEWSDKILSNEIIEVDSKRFILYFLARCWIDRKISNLLIKQGTLEVIDN
jgi:hypothetical protein